MQRESIHIGETLRQLRVDRKLSLAAVAKQAGTSAATLSRIETNKQSIDVGMLLELARILGVSTTDLLGGSDELDAMSVLARRLAALPAGHRVRVFRASVQRKARALDVMLDQVQVTVDALRDELAEFQNNVRRRERRNPRLSGIPLTSRGGGKPDD